VLVTSIAIAEPQLPFAEDFERSRTELEARGWRLAPNMTLTEDAFAGERSLRVEVAEGDPKYAEIFLPVEAGKFYRGHVMMRCEDVERNPRNSQHRGAVIFLQWADHDRGHVPGGSFPDGLFGSHDWQRREVSWTRQIPANVGYLHVLLGIEGLGTAWFDDLVVEQITDWPGPEIISPQEGETVTTQRPQLQWQEMEPRGLVQHVSLSPSPDFPPNATITGIASATTWRPGEWLEPGEWYWRLQPQGSTGDLLPPARAHRFVVAADAERWPVDIVPTWQWTGALRPTLEARIVPPREDIAVSATIAGQDADVTLERGGLVRLMPRNDLWAGLHEVHVEAVAGERTVMLDSVFSNETPGSRVTFREDGIALIDGEPFFPLGAYRDPSDELHVFSGLEEAGFNVTHSYAFEARSPQTVESAEAYLRDCHDHGLRVFLGLNRDWVYGGDLESIRRWTGELMDEPGLLCWYLMDEPAARGLTVREMRAVHDAVAGTDPFHPTVQVICRPGAYDAYAPAADLLWPDPYPLPSQPLTMVEDRIRMVLDATGDEPLWVVLQAHDGRYLHDAQERIAELGPPDQPTYEQTRCMAFMSLAAGADGLIWYWLPNSRYHIVEDSPTVWAGLVATVQELRGLMPWLVAEPRPRDSIEVADPFRTWSRVADGTRVLAVVNVSPTPARLDLDLSRFDVGEIALRGGAALELEDGRLRCEFRAYEVRVYEWAEGE